MKSYTLKTLCISLFLTILVPLKAQESSGEEPCNLPPPASLTLNLMGPDVLDVIWTAVPGANGYDVLLVDLSTNQILYSNTHYSTSTTITGITITTDMIVAVAGLCDDGEPGGYIIDGPESIHVEELVLQRGLPGGTTSTSTYTCLRDRWNNYVVNYAVNNHTVIVPVYHNQAGTRQQVKTFVEISGDPGIQDNNGNSAYSLVELYHIPNSLNLVASFPIQFGANNPTVVNQITTRTSSNSYRVDFDYSYFYDVTLGLFTGSTQATFSFNSNHEVIEISGRNCFEGTLNGGTSGLVRDNSSPVEGDISSELQKRENNFQFHPNPAGDQLFLSGQAGTQIQIMDISGRQQVSTALDSTQQVLDISTLPSGSYIIRYSDGRQSRSERLLKL